MTLSTNWEDVYQLVDDFPWVQFYSTGWAYSLMRDMNAACRIANLIGPESISVTYLVQYMSEFSTLTDTLGIPFLESVRPFLMYEGMVLDDDYQRLFAQFLRLPAIPLPVSKCNLYYIGFFLYDNNYLFFLFLYRLESVGSLLPI